MAAHCVSIVWILCFCFTLGHSLETFYLDELCGQTVDLGVLDVPACRLLLRRPENNIRHFNCPMTVAAPPGSHIIIKVTAMYIATRFGCDQNFLQFLDGTDGIDVISPELCGSIPPETSYVTGKSNVSVIFMKRLAFVADQFEVILTAAKKAPCHYDEFVCSNNLCINAQLQCNGFNNCGDGSDLCPLSVGAIAGIVIACIIVLIVVALVLAIVVYRHRKKKMDKLERYLHAYSIDGSLSRDKKFNSMSSRVSDVYATIQKERNSFKIHTLDPSSLIDYSKKTGPIGPDVMDHVVSFRAYPSPVPEKDELLFRSNSPQGMLLYKGHTITPLLDKPMEETETKKRLSEGRGSFDLVKL